MMTLCTLNMWIDKVLCFKNIIEFSVQKRGSGLITTNSILIYTHARIIRYSDHKHFIWCLKTHNLVTMCNHYAHKFYYVTVKIELHHVSNVIKVLETVFHVTNLHVHSYSHTFAIRELLLSIRRWKRTQSIMKKY